mmetsp:Transcript_1607/g.1825  ORF Transcript_1607/g.1825 Transcript_1607/m.1825 type:complete len:263 (-) Transcript_1607:76-864(-)
MSCPVETIQQWAAACTIFCCPPKEPHDEESPTARLTEETVSIDASYGSTGSLDIDSPEPPKRRVASSRRGAVRSSKHKGKDQLRAEWAAENNGQQTEYIPPELDGDETDGADSPGTPIQSKKPKTRDGSVAVSFGTKLLIKSSKKLFIEHKEGGNVEAAKKDLTNLINMQQAEEYKGDVQKCLRALYGMLGRERSTHCSICLDEFNFECQNGEQYEPVEILHECYHVFHAECLCDWRKVQRVEKRVCPECRHSQCISHAHPS